MYPSDHGPPGEARGGERTMHRNSSVGDGHRSRVGGDRSSVGGDAGSEASSDAPQYETGTTIVGLRADEGVVMAADRRMSLGGAFATNKDVQKVEQVHPTGAMAISGTVGPAQELLQQLRAESGLYAARRGQPMSVDALARTAGHLVRGRPVQPLLGAVDDTGGHVFELDGGGSVVEDAYAAGGSGMQVAYGVLERQFEPDASIEDATAAATAAIEAACERDGASGDGATIATVTGDGVAFETRGAS
jgi:proteasome beta subunit